MLQFLLHMVSRFRWQTTIISSTNAVHYRHELIVDAFNGKPMRYWLDLFTPYTWTKFRDHGADVSGFRPRQRKAAFERVKKGDIFLCYVVRLSRWCGLLEVKTDAFEDTTPIFADTDDPFVVRFMVKPLIVLDFEKAIPIEELWQGLSFTRDMAIGSVSWAQRAGIRQSLVQQALLLRADEVLE